MSTTIFDAEALADLVAEKLLAKMEARQRQTQPLPGELLSVREVARRINRSERAVRQLIAANRIQRAGSDRRVMVHREDLEKFIALERAITAPAPRR